MLEARMIFQEKCHVSIEIWYIRTHYLIILNNVFVFSYTPSINHAYVCKLVIGRLEVIESCCVSCVWFPHCSAGSRQSVVISRFPAFN